MAKLIAPNLWQLDIPLIGNPLKNLNSYLLVGEDRSLLIDTGFDQVACWEALNAQLDEIGIDRTRLDIFLTHLHSDHTGLAPRLHHNGCRVYIGEIDGPLVLEGLEDSFWNTLYQDYVSNGFSWDEITHLWDNNPAQNDAPKSWSHGFTYLYNGDSLHYAGHTLRCILTPGHTPGHMCLYSEEAHWLFSGDHILFHITPNICRWSVMPDALGSYLESLSLIYNLPVDLLLPAHRQETGSLTERIDELKAHHDRRIQNTLDIVTQRPGLNAYEIAGHMAWSIRSRNWEEFPLTQKFFAVGETLAHLDYLTIRGKLIVRKEGELFRYYPELH